jgi:hypothetical protein
MTRAEMRTMLRRRLNETSAAASYWSDTDLNVLLTTAAMDVQKRLLQLNKLCLLVWYLTDLTTERFVPKPIGFWWEYEVGVKMTGGASDFSYIKPFPYKLLRDTQDAGYAHVGRYLYITPQATEVVSGGIQLLYTPLVSMSDDTSVPDINPSLHIAIVVQAHRRALKEAGETPMMQALDAEWKEFDGDFYLVATQSAAEGGHLWIPAESVGRQVL